MDRSQLVEIDFWRRSGGRFLVSGFWFLEFDVAGWTGIEGSLGDLPCFQP
jgi:hypothetical protein